jgi:Cyclin, N-terminal domain
MDFDRSTQARSWLFDSITLLQCRQEAVDDQPTATETTRVARVRKFASGFHNSRHADDSLEHSRADFDPPVHSSCSTGESSLFFESILRRKSPLSVQEQETLVRFHAHLLTMLVGPYAVFQGLVRSPSVLATAIVFFRRFYMSNSVLDFEPRKIAVAAAFLASKVEDSIIEVSLAGPE